MCGIVGTVRRRPDRDMPPLQQRRAALKALRHRGPDAHGEYQDAQIWFGHTRLSILDLSPAGNQPMQTADGRYVVTYNGEVYNFRSLARTAAIKDLRSGSDTEVVLRKFANQGVASFREFNGMFAFAIYDAKAQKLWLVRDRLGVKPLYYQLDEERLSFASEIKAIAALHPEDYSCNYAALHEWLYYGNPLAERTLYAGIEQLLPGHYLQLDLRSFEHEIHAYWTLDQHLNDTVESRVSGAEAIDETRTLLENAVRRQLVSDVPVGVFLSGGIDSSAIVAFASRHYERRLATYSAGFDFAVDGGELPKASRTAARFGTEHHEFHIQGTMVGELIEKMVSQHDMPFADAANIPLYLMAAEIGQASKVILQGDGGDELFGGYRRYATLNYYAPMHRVARLLQRLIRLTPRSALQFRIQRYVHAFAAADLATTMALLLTVEDKHLGPTDIFAPTLRRAVEQSNPFHRFADCLSRFASQDIGNQMSLVDLMIVLPDTYLEKVDRATMAASLEVRVPFLDYDLVDYVVRLPGRMKMPWGRKKWLLKQALDGIVPAEVLYGPKTGLEVPYGKWLQGALKPMFFDLLNQFARSNPDILNAARITEMFERTETRVQNHSYMLWKVLNFMIWSQKANVRFSN